MGKESIEHHRQIEYFTRPNRHTIILDTRRLEKIEREVLLGAHRHLLVVGYEGIQPNEPGNHAVGAIGYDKFSGRSYCTFASHSFGDSTRIYHPHSGALLLTSGTTESISIKGPPDTTLIPIHDNLMSGTGGVPIGPMMPGENCWMAAIKHTEYDEFLISMAIKSATVTGENGIDKHGVVCPVLACTDPMIGPGSSGSPVFQMYREQLHLVAVLHGLSIDNRVMVSPMPSELFENVPGNFLG